MARALVDDAATAGRPLGHPTGPHPMATLTALGGWVTAVAAVVIGSLAGTDAWLPLVGILAVVGLGLTLLAPEAVLVLAVCSLAVNIELTLAEELGAASLLGQLQKAALLIAVLVILGRRGIRWAGLLPAAVYGGYALLTMIDPRDAVLAMPSATLRSLFGLGLPVLVLAIAWEDVDAAVRRALLRTLAALPPLSVAVAVLLDLAGLHALVYRGFFEVWRLQGAMIPPQLAMLCVVGVGAGLYAAVAWSDRTAAALVATNLALCVLSGTRGAIIAVMIIVLGFAARVITWKKGRQRWVALGLLVVVLSAGAAATALYWPMLSKRLGVPDGDGGINTSGRLEAWETYVDLLADAPLLGLGVGSGVAIEADPNGAFQVPHNEYLRAVFELGYPGGALFVLGMAVAVTVALRRTDRTGAAVAWPAVLAFAVYSVVENTLSAVQFSVPFAVLLGVLGSTRSLTPPARTPLTSPAAGPVADHPAPVEDPVRTPTGSAR